MNPQIPLFVTVDNPQSLPRKERGRALLQGLMFLTEMTITESSVFLIQLGLTDEEVISVIQELYSAN